MLPMIHLAVLLTEPATAMVPMDPADPRLPLVIQDVSPDLIVAQDDAYKALASAIQQCHNAERSLGNGGWQGPGQITVSESVKATQTWERERPDAMGSFSVGLRKSEDVSHIYMTSGSTGRPKGCISTHGALASYCSAKNVAHQVTSDSICFVASAPSFDPSYGDFMASWSIGATVASADRQTIFTMLGECLKETGATHVLTTPSLFNTILHDKLGPKDLPALRTIALGGEPMSLETVRVWADAARLINTYGVTECCVYQAYAIVRDAASRKLIGEALEGNTLLVMTNNGELEMLADTDPAAMLAVTPGKESTGELWIAGKQVGVGYLNRSELTQKKFIHHPTLGRCFRTGDVVKVFSQDGKDHMRLLGRLDHQVKISGQRVDLEECEVALLACATDILLSQAAVVLHQETKQLVAFCVPQDAEGIFTDDHHQRMLIELLRTLSAERLPRHMIPSRFIFVKELPQTSTGKIARTSQAKQPLPFLNGESIDNEETYGGWTAAIEKVWKKEMGFAASARLGNLAHFQEHGGDSLTALRICKELANVAGGLKSQQTSKEESDGTFGELLGQLAPAELLKRPVLGSFARYIQECFGSLDPDSQSQLREISDEGRTIKITDIFSAAGAGATAIVRFFVQKRGVDPGGGAAQDNLRLATPLHCACLNGHVDTARYLLEAGANPGAIDTHGRTPFHLACQSGSLPLVSVLNDAYKPSNKKGTVSLFLRQDTSGQSPLHYAARAGAPSSILELLLSKSPKPELFLELRDEWRRTALHWAVVNGHRNAAQTLLAWGGDRQAVDSAGETPLDVAERRARCGANERQAGVGASVFGDIAKLLGGSGATKNVSRFS
ncbi:uncharacterized protein EV422DRAFT_204812 [Fimicolochytrium jonesii]|uniref:uncharacterized protein n=1 Tax=Fimicolochytrium jonesii TaxID=1396493 RepID=UPI0022FDB798|nr:uncharacterized protein EV422DRAFT_204812 [Fimicolochytrium jonesii]KAI8817764.1 hypothetical protein EV422DRAFT_204812 [Fimicolochytrium jonesii]